MVFGSACRTISKKSLKSFLNNLMPFIIWCGFNCLEPQSITMNMCSRVVLFKSNDFIHSVQGSWRPLSKVGSRIDLFEVRILWRQLGWWLQFSWFEVIWVGLGSSFSKGNASGGEWFVGRSLVNNSSRPWCSWLRDTSRGHMACRQVWVYTYTHGTHLVSSRESRGDPVENPTKHPGGTWRLLGPQGPSVRHQALPSQPCTASENTGEAIRTQVLVTSPPRPPSERANVRTYVRTLGQVEAIATYTVQNHMYRRLAQCRGRFQYNNVVCSMEPAQWEDQCALTERQMNTRPVPSVPGNREIHKVLQRLHEICKRTHPRLAPC